MAWRYRKSIKILPGVKLNLNGKSASVSIGTRGIHTTINTNGVVTNSVGLPGTGLSYRTSHKIGSNNQKQHTANSSSNCNRIQPDANQSSLINSKKAFIKSLYADNIGRFDWVGVLGKPLKSDSPEAFKEVKSLAYKVLAGDSEAYNRAVQLFHPFSDILSLGCNLEIKVVDSKTISIHFSVNSKSSLKEIVGLRPEIANDLLQDFVCGIAISIARDVFYLLPVDVVYVDVDDFGIDVLSVCFDLPHFALLDLTTIDASDTVEQFRHRMNWTKEKGFEPIVFLDDFLM